MTFEGSKYQETKELDITALAKRIRQDIAHASRATNHTLRTLPKDLKVSVRISRYSMGQSIDVFVKKCSFQIENPMRVRHQHRFPHAAQLSPLAHPRLTAEAEAVLKRLEDIALAYQWDESDPQADLYNSRFHLRLEFDWLLRRDQNQALIAGGE